MAQERVKVVDHVKGSISTIAGDTERYQSILNNLQPTMDLEKETLHLIVFDNYGIAQDVINIQSGDGTSSAVAIDQAKFESTLEYMEKLAAKGINMQWGLTHNHPVMLGTDGKELMTGISDGDYIVTKAAREVAESIAPNVEYMGHFIANKKNGVDRVLWMEGHVTYDQLVIDKIRKGEL